MTEKCKWPGCKRGCGKWNVKRAIHRYSLTFLAATNSERPIWRTHIMRPTSWAATCNTAMNAKLLLQDRSGFPVKKTSVSW